MKRNEFKELKEVYKEIRTLKFEEEPNYNKYIKILNEWIKNNNQEKDNNFCLKWEKKLKKIYMNIKSRILKIKNDSKLKILFEGFPNKYIMDYLENIYININNN